MPRTVVSMTCVKMRHFPGLRSRIQGMKKGQRRAKVGSVQYNATGNGHAVGFTPARLLLDVRDENGKVHSVELWEEFREYYNSIKLGANKISLTATIFKQIEKAMSATVDVHINAVGSPVCVTDAELMAWFTRI